VLRPGVQGSDRLILHVSDCRLFFRRFRRYNGKETYRSFKIHGKCILPPGYGLAILPPSVTVSGIDVCQTADGQMPEGSVISESLSCSYSFSRALVAVVQTIYASVTLYRTKGDQVQHYGYAAFGLTVVPYLIMSIVNLISTIVTPDYPTVYLVRSDIMDEASTPQRKGRFEGIVGSIESSYSSADAKSFDATFEESSEGRMFLRKRLSSAEPGHDSIDEEKFFEVHMGTDERHSRDTELIVPFSSEFEGSDLEESYWNHEIFNFFGIILIECVAIAIIGGLSRFRVEKSTRAQRIWTMTWLAFGIFWGLFVGSIFDSRFDFDDDDDPYDCTRSFSAFFGRMFFCAPAIGGFVVVCQMLRNYGRCIRIY
jgi:hypothetical protein